MRGENITNIYIIDSIEYRIEELNDDQLVYINCMANKQKYNDLKQQVLTEKGEDVHAFIKIFFPQQDMMVEYPEK